MIEIKILILYASKHGTTERCAETLADRLRGSNEIVLHDANKGLPPSPDGFDTVILGSSVRMGAVSKNIKKYIKQNMERLNEIPCAVFLCCGFPDEFDEYVDSQFSRKFIPSYGFHCFGGELKPKNVKGFERILVKMIRNSITQHDFEDSNYKTSLPEIIPEHISILADRIMNK